MVQRESRCSPWPPSPIKGLMEFVAGHNMPPKREETFTGSIKLRFYVLFQIVDEKLSFSADCYHRGTFSV